MGGIWLATKARANKKREGESIVIPRKAQSEENSNSGAIRIVSRCCQILEKQAKARINDAKISQMKTADVHEAEKAICL